MARGARRVSLEEWVRASLFRFLLLLLVWLILAGTTDALGFGVAIALAACALSLWLTRPAEHHLKLLRLPGFTAFFLWQSLLAGWDVARRTLNPALPLHPEILELKVHLPAGAPTWWLMLIITLLPGTLSVRLQHPGRLEVHCLDARQSVATSIRETEQQILRLFGLSDVPILAKEPGETP